MENEETKSQEDIDWESRTLCIDESCIGVIGPDGRCKECGKAYDSDQKESSLPEPELAEPGPDEEFSEDEEFAEDEEFTEDEDSESKEDIDWESRILCSDESCIGVIGPDGRCKECGKPYAEE
jgi:hypothetical protein